MAPPPAGAETRDRKKSVYAFEGDLYLYDFSSDKARQLTKTADVESNPQFTHDEKHVAFMRGGNLYVMSLEDGMIEQMTEITPAGAPPAAAAPAGFGGRGGRGGAPPTAASEQKGTDSQEFLKKQERELIEVVRDRAKLREENEAKRKKEHPRKPFPLQQRQTVARLELCPDEKCVVALIGEAGQGTKGENVPSYVNESAYTEDIPGRNNVGDNQNRLRAAMVDVATGEVKWVDAGLANREVQMQTPLWNEQGTKAVMVARAVDNKDRWILALDPATGKTRVLFTEHDDAWLNGPGAQTLGWLKDGNEIYFQSERDGYSHLYEIGFDGGEPKQLTSGKFEVTSVELSNDGSKFYLTTSEVGPGERHFYSMSVSGGARSQLTKEAGSHRVVLSPDEKHTADVYSYANKPPELLIDGKKATSSPAPEFWDYPWLDVPIVQVPARDGKMVPAHFYIGPKISAMTFSMAKRVISCFSFCIRLRVLSISARRRRYFSLYSFNSSSAAFGFWASDIGIGYFSSVIYSPKDLGISWFDLLIKKLGSDRGILDLAFEMRDERDRACEKKF